ncbi:MAG: AtpZ/AtpI family protein [Firmicutes bacterium]|nr:AtpZ/AtpI family protein [Bacillota bacterium]
MVKKRGTGASVWRALGLMTNIGITMAASVFIGYYMGHYLDKLLQNWIHYTNPWLTMIFSLFGVAAGFRGVFRLINQSLREGGKE